jgi:hypothetical protein
MCLELQLIQDGYSSLRLVTDIINHALRTNSSTNDGTPCLLWKKKVVLGGLVVIVLVIRPKVPGYKPGR